MAYSEVRRPMPHLRLPADYLFNPLYLIPTERRASPAVGDGAVVVTAAPHDPSHTVVPCSTYLHCPLHFTPVSSHATPVRSRSDQRGSGERRPTRTPGGGSSSSTPHVGANASSVRRASPHTSGATPLRRRGQVIAHEAAAWQRRAPVEYLEEAESPITTGRGGDTSILRPTRATQLRDDHVQHSIEERDEAATNIFHMPTAQRQRHALPTVLFASSSFATPTRRRSSSAAAASASSPRSTRASQLRHVAAAQRIEELERCRVAEAAAAAQEEVEEAVIAAGTSSLAQAQPVGAGAQPRRSQTRSAAQHTPASAIPQEKWRSAAVAHIDTRETAAESPVLEAPAPLSRPRQQRHRPHTAALVSHRSADDTAGNGSAATAAAAAASLAASARVSTARPSSRHRDRTVPREADLPSPAPTWRSRSTASHRTPSRSVTTASTHAVSSPEPAQGSSTTPSTPAAAAAAVSPPVEITEVRMTPEDGELPARLGPLTSSSESSIMFTVSPAQGGDIAGVHPPEVRREWLPVPTQTSQLHDGHDESDESAPELLHTSRSLSERSPVGHVLDHEPADVALSCADGGEVVPSVPTAPAAAAVVRLSSPSPTSPPPASAAAASPVRDEVQSRASASHASSGMSTVDSWPDKAGGEDEAEETSSAADASPPPTPSHSVERHTRNAHAESPLLSTAGASVRGETSSTLVDAAPAAIVAASPASRETTVERQCDSTALRDSQRASSGTDRGSAEHVRRPVAHDAATDLVVGATLRDADADSAHSRGGSAMSASASFASIDSYHTDTTPDLDVCAGGPADAGESPDSAARQAELLRRCRAGTLASAAPPTHGARGDAGASSRSSSAAPVSSGAGPAGRASSHGHGTPCHRVEEPLSPLLLWRASHDVTTAHSTVSPTALSMRSDASRSARGGASGALASGDVSALSPWCLPVPPTNYSHAAAAWSARQRTTRTAERTTEWGGSDHRTWQQLRAGAVVPPPPPPPYQPRMDGPVWKTAVDSLRLPHLQESGGGPSSPPSAAPATSAAAAAEARAKSSSSSSADCGAAGVHGAGRTADARRGAASVAVAVPLQAGAGAAPPPPTAEPAAMPEALLSAAETAQTVTTGPALPPQRCAPGPTHHDAPWHRDVRRYTIGGGERRAAAAPAVVDSAASQPSLPVSHITAPAPVVHAAWNVAESSGAARPESSSSVSPRSQTGAPVEVTEEEEVRAAAVATEDAAAGAAVLADVAASCPAAPRAGVRNAVSGLRKSAKAVDACVVQPHVAATRSVETCATASCPAPPPPCSAADGAARDGDACARLPAATAPPPPPAPPQPSLPLTPRPRTPELTSATASTLPTAHGSFSLPATETERSPLEPCQRNSDGGGEDSADGAPRSHAPTPLSSRLPRRQRRPSTPPHHHSAHAAVAAISGAERRSSGAPSAQSFSRSDASTRSLNGAVVDFHTALYVLERASESEEEETVEDRECVAQEEAGGPPSADVTHELAAPPPPRSQHESSVDSSTSAEAEATVGARLPLLFSSASSSFATTPTARSRSMSKSLGRSDVPPPQDGAEAAVVDASGADTAAAGGGGGDAVAAVREATAGDDEGTPPPPASPSPPAVAVAVAVAVPATVEAASAVHELVSSPSRPPSPVPGSDFHMTRSLVSEQVAWSAGTWVDRERASASPDHAEVGGAAERGLDVLRSLTRSAPTVPLTRVKYVHIDL
ncbi:hypothetical protein NESM_000706700 [Novymonas esmeraldas]|uniref:Uncharacterized protein n=1 Tax=Novymonas esmeraldas TaxID=1808958 RepID=A0AAW0EUX2_9TRYP